MKVPCGNRTRLSSLEGWHLCRSAKGTCNHIEAEAVGLEATSEIHSPPVFKQCSTTAARAFLLPAGRRPGLASSWVTSIQLRWQESNLRLGD